MLLGMVQLIQAQNASDDNKTKRRQGGGDVLGTLQGEWKVRPSRARRHSLALAASHPEESTIRCEGKQ